MQIQTGGRGDGPTRMTGKVSLGNLVQGRGENAGGAQKAYLSMSDWIG